MKMRLWYRRRWLTELVALVVGGLVGLVLYKGVGWDGGWWLFLGVGLVVTVVAELPLRKARREREAATAEMQRFIREVIDPAQREWEREHEARDGWPGPARSSGGAC
ncbi:hypothetical protein ACODT3_39915 [Streptomyces sp. 4.24]|uniref:hypothetical protein n=1 Tax=Streptomyces tritrimontium TaxID=3406573 RepID=UPI003BB7F6B7